MFIAVSAGVSCIVIPSSACSASFDEEQSLITGISAGGIARRSVKRIAAIFELRMEIVDRAICSNAGSGYADEIKIIKSNPCYAIQSANRASPHALPR